MTNLYLEKPNVRLMLSLVVLLLFAQLSYGQDLSISNTSSNIGSGAYSWTVYVEASQSVLNRIDYVEYLLPNAYGKNALRKSSNRGGRYPFSIADKAFQPFSIGVTIFYRDSKPQRLPDYTLNFDGPIINPGGVAVTPLMKLREKNTLGIYVPEIQGEFSVYIDDLHDILKGKPFYIKISKAGSAIKETKVKAGPNVSLPFSYGGHEYVLTGYTKTTIFAGDYLYFKIYRKK